MGPRAGLDDVEKRKFLPLPGLELRHLGRPARSQSLYRPQRYRLRYPGSTPVKVPKNARIRVEYNVPISRAVIITVTLLTRTQEVPGSNHCQDTG
jgi:hypothetical protein